MDKENIIDLLTLFKYFDSERSALEAKQMFPKLWEARRQDVVTWLSRNGII